MAYTPRVWVDRAVQFANRYLKSGETSTSVTLTADPGTVTQAGTPVNAANLNVLENALAAAHVTADGALQRSGGTMTGDVTFQKVSPTVRFIDTADLSQQARFVNAGAYFYLQRLDGTGAWVRDLARWNKDNGDIQLLNDVYIAGDKLPKTRVHSSGTYIEWFDGSTWQGVGGVKSIQRGTKTNALGVVNTDITISSVNTAKAVVNLLSNTMSQGEFAISLQLVNSTTLRILHPSLATTTYTISWEVIEHY